MTDRDPQLERMLEGGPLPPALAALRSPAHPAELRGEEAALAAFRAARASAPPAGRVRARVVGRALVVKVAVAGAVLAGGGLAVAAATGTLPSPSSTRPPATDQRAPGRPGGVVHEDRPTVAPHPATPPVTSAPPVSPGATPGNGNGNGWGRGHGTGKPSKSPKPTKKPKKSKEPKAPTEGSTG
ncbi:hypothetical protein Ais01nite_04350 [Asanoa ishikariensis]|uniref:Uncharacterized protein n=1 Tax=Asanoa ishikariensis TaxID=137265 RepID=A0A1H3THU3_9ACTN|nr:hypothetical protein [Asanoa ishikariensis]GIF62400.1 hypothetical protein Ais01nite_04350 [Asanoa ishikariensis]SDZ49824.1 hypothetical protein SAMN05421684_5796 [Asanoa ishikariensis]